MLGVKSMRNRYKKRTGIGIIAIFVLLICGTVVYKRIDLQVEREKLNNRIERLDSQIKEQEEKKEEIKKLSAYVQTKRYVEDVAREKLGLVYEDEIILKPKD